MASFVSFVIFTLLTPATASALSCAAARTALSQAKSSIRQCLTVRAMEKSRCQSKQKEPCLVRQCPKADLSHAKSDEKWFCLKTSEAGALQSVISETTEAEDLERLADTL